MDTNQWVEFLAERFDGTEYAAKRSEYFGWIAAGVSEDDDPEDVAAAWIEREVEGNPCAEVVEVAFCDRCGASGCDDRLYAADAVRASCRAAGSAAAFLGRRDNVGWVHLCDDCRTEADEEYGY